MKIDKIIDTYLVKEDNDAKRKDARMKALQKKIKAKREEYEDIDVGEYPERANQVDRELDRLEMELKRVRDFE